MGIPHLASRLHSYASSVQFHQTEDFQADRRAVIDGPAFAFHIYNLCRSTKEKDARNALQAQPSYQELGIAAIKWLESIEPYNFHVSAIFFDGILPYHKRDVRISRLQSSLNQLNTFKALHPNEVLQKHASQASNHPKSKSQRKESYLGTLPAPPFLVPAVIEALISSKYREQTAVVPAEADVWCATDVKYQGGTVLTSDSDLLLYDLGSEGSVIFFRDLDFGKRDEGKSVLSCEIYHPREISDRLGLKELSQLGFVLGKRHHRTFEECIQLSKKCLESNEEYAAFKGEYLQEREPNSNSSPNIKSPELRARLSTLDPRISELVYPVLNDEMSIWSSHQEQPYSAEAREYLVHLPLLIDDPSGVSAWECGQDLRSLAYSFLGLTLRKSCSVHEMKRRGVSISSVEIGVLNRIAIIQAVEALTSTIRDWKGAGNGLVEAESWRLLGAYIVCQSLLSHQRPLPAIADIRSCIESLNDNSRWGAIQLWAQVQASLYSLRILKQTSGIVLSAGIDHIDGEVGVSLQSMHQELCSLLPLGPLLSECSSESKSISGKEIIEELAGRLGVKADAFNEPKASRTRRRKGKKPGKSDKKPSVITPAFTNNMYYLLPNG